MDSQARLRLVAGTAACAMLGIACPARAAYTVLHTHEVRSAFPRAGLVANSSGWLYGSTVSGGDTNHGSIYTVREDGTGFATLHSFDDGDGSVHSPISTLVLDEAGFLYGTRSPNGAPGRGSVFTLKTDGTGYRVLHEFNGGRDDGANPEAALLLDRSGNLYGTTVLGGTSDLGTVFKIRKDGSRFAVLHSFSVDGDGFCPRAGLIVDRSQNLYGTAEGFGGSAAPTPGTVFTLKTNGSGFRVLHWFRDGPADGVRSFRNSPTVAARFA